MEAPACLVGAILKGSGLEPQLSPKKDPENLVGKYHEHTSLIPVSFYIIPAIFSRFAMRGSHCSPIEPEGSLSRPTSFKPAES